MHPRYPLERINLHSLLGFVGFTSLLTVGFGFATYLSSERLLQADRARDEVLALQATVLHDDEILTMSARMAAATGDTKWELRYREFEPQLAQALQRLKLLGLQPRAQGLAEETDAANARLVEMENRAFALVRAGEGRAAAALLASPAYEDQKTIYSRGMLELQQQMSDSAARDLIEYQTLARWLALSLTLFLLLSFGGWIAITVLSRRSRSRLKDLNEHIIRLQESERSRIAQEIHDDAGQQLSAAKIWLSRLESDGSNAVDAHALRETRSLIDSTVAKLRNISHALHPSMIGNLGLDAAIEWNLRQTAEPAELAWDFLCDCPEALARLDREKQIHVYRVIQEAIQNVQKHARASAVTVRVQREKGRIIVDVLDDGVGIQSGRKGLGFISMQERAYTLGGKLSTKSPLPARVRRELGIEGGAAGTMISFEFPG